MEYSKENESRCRKFCPGFCLPKRDQDSEQQIYLKERERIETYLQKTEDAQDQIPVPCLSPPLSNRPRRQATFSGHQYSYESPLRSIRDQEYFDPLKRHSIVIIDEMHMRFKSRPGVSDRRNAMESSSHRKSLMQGILSVTSGEGKSPMPQLKEGKQLPLYLGKENDEYSIPECCNKPLEDPDDYYDGNTYIVVNKQGTIFRFSKAKCLFLFDRENKLRTAAVNLFMRPMFAHFITLIILCNCMSMVLVEPPKWIDYYLEYVFTLIYILEAAVKILARGFVLHRFSYLRDPWNWLDFIVIVTAIVTEVLKAVVSQDMFAKVAVLRAFRVLRALKTMSIVPGLRAIVKALLRSIKALKDAVVLTVFCVSVFALVGYQLFHGTMRHKCVRIAGSHQLEPDAMFMQFNFDYPAFHNKTIDDLDLQFAEFRTNNTGLKHNTTHYPWPASSSRGLLPLYRTEIPKWDIDCREQHAVKGTSGRAYSFADVELLDAFVNETRGVWRDHNTTNQAMNVSEQVRSCTINTRLRINTTVFSSLLRIADRADTLVHPGIHGSAFDYGKWNCAAFNSPADNNATGKAPPFNCEVLIILQAADIACLNETDRNPSDQALHAINGTDQNQWKELLDFGNNTIPRWSTREFIITFRLLSNTSPGSAAEDLGSSSFVYYSELSEERTDELGLLKLWRDNDDNQCKSEPKTGLFFYSNSSNRPPPEPIYCTIGKDDHCPPGYICAEAGQNPDFGYTGFDQFSLAFLTSFRLVALDAWSRLYYLTLHTTGPTYAIFYMLVVFLGSYYLVNLILAVVYMAYEEQQAVVEEEEIEAQEREAEKRENENVRDSSDKSDSERDGVSASDVEQGAAAMRVGLITTSLGPISAVGSRSTLSLRRKRRRARPRPMTVAVHDAGNRSSDEDGENCANSTTHSLLRRVKSDTTQNGVDDEELHNFSHRRAVSMRRSRPKKEDPNPNSPRKMSMPTIELVVTKPTCTSLDKLGVPEKLEKEPATTGNFLAVQNPHRRSMAPSENGSFVSFAISEYSQASEDFDEARLQQIARVPPPDARFPILLPVRRLSETSSVFDASEETNDQVVEADVNLLLPPRISGDPSNRITFSSSSSGASTPLSPLSIRSSPVSVCSHACRKPCESPVDLTGGDQPKIHAESEPMNFDRYGMGPAQFYQENNRLLSPVSSSPVKIAPIPGNGTKNGVKSNGVLCDEDLQVTAANGMSTKSKEAEGSVLVAKKNKKRKPKKKSLFSRFLRAFTNICAKWTCCPAGLTKVQAKIRDLVLNPFTDLVITLCIALNALFMAIDHHPMQPWFTIMLENANLFFTFVFTVEMLTKIIGLSPYTYFRQRWNVFDAVVVLFSLLEIALDTSGGLSVLRAFRLMRIIKLAKQWPTLNKLLRIIGRTLGKLWHLTLVFLLVLYVFAVVGMQLLHKYYRNKYEDNQPRWNFVDFPHAFMVVFRIQCGEWVENMFICLNVATPEICIPLFVLVYVIGNLVILNLFLALLLNSFSGDVLQHTASESNSISEAFRRAKMWARNQRKSIANLRINQYCCQMLKLGVRRTPTKTNHVVSSNGGVKTPDTELTVMTSDTGDDKPSLQSQKEVHLNAAHPNENDDVAGEEETMLLHPSTAVVATNGDINQNSRLSVGSLSPNAQSNRSCVRSGSHCPISSSSFYSDASVRSMPPRRGRRRARRHARERYRGLSSSWDSNGYGSADSRSASGHTRSNSRQNPAEKESDQNEERSEENVEEAEESNKKTIEPCLTCWSDSFFDRGWFFRLRTYTYKIIEHRYFDNVVIFCILLSSITLAMEDIHLHERPAMERALTVIDIFCCVFFTVEMVMKWVGYGWKHYFTNPWCLLDCVIVLISIINLSLSSNGNANLSALRALRTFRALRPLRALSRFQGMKIVVDALIRAVPSIAHVFIVCLVFWLIFSILGVNIFGGRFGRCVALPTGDILPRRFLDAEEATRLNAKWWKPTNVTLEDQCSTSNTLLKQYLQRQISALDIDTRSVLPAVRNKEECDRCAQMLNTTDINWQVPSINFDSVPAGYLTLIQVATFNGWLEIMESAIDITGVEEQPSYEASFYNYIYFCVFIVFGAFFSLNLFIGVIIDNFNQQKIKSKGGEDGVFLTDEQRRYYNAMKQMTKKTPRKPIPRPDNAFANKVYDIVTNRKFEIAVMLMIMLNMVVMAIEYHDMSPEMNKLLQNFNLGFICIFLAEAILKLIGLRLYYFTVPWNVFDIFVVVVSLIVNCMSTATGLNDVIMTQYFVQPTLFRIIRLFRVTRILRLIREAKGIRTLLFALMMSLPALFNIGSLLFLLMSIYAIIGMSQFPYIQKVSGVDDILNFETFPGAFLVLFQVSTSEGWDKFVDPVLRDTPPYCDPSPPGNQKSNCGNSTIGIIYFVTYVMTTFLIVVNMYIAIILENFEVATRENAEPLTADDFEQFFEVWQRYDDRLTQFVSYEDLQNMLDHLDFPLRVPRPNAPFIANSHMRVTTDGRVHCLEVIIALIKKVLGDSPELKVLKEEMLQSFLLKCKTKEEITEIKETLDAEEFTIRVRAANIIQRAYREYRLNDLNRPLAKEYSSSCSDDATTSEEESRS